MAAEGERLQKEINKLHKDLEKIKSKLANENYLAKAPKEIVAQKQLVWRNKNIITKITRTIDKYYMTNRRK